MDGYVFHGDGGQLLFVDADPMPIADYIHQIFAVIQRFNPLRINLYQHGINQQCAKHAPRSAHRPHTP